MSKSATGSAGAAGGNCSRDSQRQEGASSLAGVQTSGIMSKRKKAVESLYYVGDSQAPLEPETKTNPLDVVYDECSFPGSATGRSNGAEFNLKQNVSYSYLPANSSFKTYEDDIPKKMSDLADSSGKRSPISHYHVFDSVPGSNSSSKRRIRHCRQSLFFIAWILMAVALVAVTICLSLLYTELEEIKSEVNTCKDKSSKVSVLSASVGELKSTLERSSDCCQNDSGILEQSLFLLNLTVHQCEQNFSVTRRNFLGQVSTIPAASCDEVFQATPSLPRGYYWIRSPGNGSATRTNC